VENGGTVSLPPPVPPQGRKYNTGPKGVLEDYKHFKEMEAQKRREKQENDRKVAKNCMTARTHAADEEAKKKIDEEEADEDDEEFLEAYRRQRMSEIAQTYKKANNSKTSKMFGSVLQLTRETFLDAVDNEDALVTVVVLITESTRRGCREMTSAFQQLPQLYPSSKFCVISAAEVGTSLKFKMEALPAILVYKGGDVVGNFIRLCDDLGEDACASDLEGFLVEHGMLCADTTAAAVPPAKTQRDGGRIKTMTTMMTAMTIETRWK